MYPNKQTLQTVTKEQYDHTVSYYMAKYNDDIATARAAADRRYIIKDIAPPIDQNRCADCGAIVTSERDPRRGVYFCNDECMSEFDTSNGSFESDF